MLKMDQVHVLRHKVLKEGQSVRRVARELGLSRSTVTKYLDQPRLTASPISLLRMGYRQRKTLPEQRFRLRKTLVT